jgi:cytochrome b561
MWRDTEDRYGLVSLTLHWSMALVIPALFILGLWMVDLDYYDAWYRRAPEIHKGTGILMFLALIARVLWRALSRRPRPEPGLSSFEHIASQVVHIALYVLLFAVMISGYLISTADGRPIEVFGLFQVPAALAGLPNQADVAGRFHLTLAVALVALAGVHVLAAFKHHFLHRDRTLLRMLGRRSNRPSSTTPRKRP